MGDVPKRLYARLIDQDEDDLDGLPDAVAEAVAEAVPGNATRQVAALTLQKVGDVVIDPKTVLAWLLASVGAPAALAGLLVPIREAGSLLPQARLVPLVRRYAVRRWVWIAGAMGQAAAVYARVVEAPRPPDIEHRSRGGALALPRDDAPFRRFVVARTLLLVSALSPPSCTRWPTCSWRCPTWAPGSGA